MKRIDTEVLTPDDMEKEKWRNLSMALFREHSKIKLEKEQEHQRYITTQGMYDELANEFQGQLRKTMEAQKLAREENSVLYAAHCDIQEIVKGTKGGFNLKITWAMVAIIFLAALVASPDLRVWLGANMLAVGLIIIGFALLTLFVFKKGK